MALASIYESARYRDPRQAGKHRKAFARACPSSLAGFESLRDIDDPEFLKERAGTLRSLLQNHVDEKHPLYYDTLWDLEFRVKPPARHDEVREQVKKDLARLRDTVAVESTDGLMLLRQGYRTIEDPVGARWAEDRILNRFPSSATAVQLIQERWEADHPFPGADAPAKETQAYYRSSFETSEDWVRRRPGDLLVWLSRFSALEHLADVPLRDFKAVVDGLQAARPQYQGYTFGLPPVPIRIARLYLERNFRRDHIPDLVEEGFREQELLRAEASRSDWWDGTTLAIFDSNLRETHWNGWPILIEYCVKSRDHDRALEVLAEMRESLDEEDVGSQATNEMRRAHAGHEAIYWEQMGRLAEEQRRRPDALAFYQRALSARARSGGSAQDTDGTLKHRTTRLWKALGGTDEGWNAWTVEENPLRTVGEAPEISSWEPRETPLPDFSFQDLNGRTWHSADLKGKVTLINVWATWCAPCRWELPYLQEMYESVNPRSDVLVLTFNVDESIGLVEPYLQRNRFSFPVLAAGAYVKPLLGPGGHSPYLDPGSRGSDRMGAVRVREGRRAVGRGNFADDRKNWRNTVIPRTGRARGVLETKRA